MIQVLTNQTKFNKIISTFEIRTLKFEEIKESVYVSLSVCGAWRVEG